jgi:redox-sensing transcriptional repressor
LRGDRELPGAKARPERRPKVQHPRAVERLSLYLRQVESLARRGVTTVSSSDLGRALGLTPAQVRKDFGTVGPLGARGVGYRVELLARALRRALGTDRTWKLALVGVGHLGSALVRHRQFREQGFEFAALFDKDPALRGKLVEGLAVRPLEDLAEVVPAAEIRLAVIAVPAPEAQRVASLLVRAGVKGILNFTSVALDVPGDVAVSGVDLAIHLEGLTHHLASLRSPP